MAKKYKSLQQLIDLLAETFTIVCMSEACILDTPVEEWPVVDALISFFSAGFPLEKSMKYADLRKPICFNDPKLQGILLDRREVRWQRSQQAKPRK